MEKIEKEMKVGFGKSYESQGRPVVINRVIYFNQISCNVDLCNNNYHLMFNLLIKLINGRNNLRVEVPAWYSTTEVIEYDGKNIEKINKGKNNGMKDESTDSKRDYRMWRKPKKVHRVMEMNKRKMVENNDNFYNVLSEEDYEEEY